jgi:hypothetical protein
VNVRLGSRPNLTEKAPRFFGAPRKKNAAPDPVLSVSDALVSSVVHRTLLQNGFLDQNEVWEGSNVSVQSPGQRDQAVNNALDEANEGAHQGAPGEEGDGEQGRFEIGTTNQSNKPLGFLCFQAV